MRMGVSPKAMATAEKRQAFLEDTSTIILKNRTIEYLRELTAEMPQKDLNKDNKFTFDGLLVDMIRVYRKKKGLDYGIWSDDH